MSPMLFLCVCDREWCYCTNRVMTQNAPCFMCLEGAHQEAPDPIRPPATDEEPWTLPFQPDVEKPGCATSYRGLIVGFIPLALLVGACWAMVVIAVAVARRLVAG